MFGRIKVAFAKWFYRTVATNLPSSYLPGKEWTRKVRAWCGKYYLDKVGTNVNIEPHVTLAWGGLN